MKQKCMYNTILHYNWCLFHKRQRPTRTHAVGCHKLKYVYTANLFMDGTNGEK